jgi:hypothetical protein
MPLTIGEAQGVGGEPFGAGDCHAGRRIEAATVQDYCFFHRNLKGQAFG